MNNSFRLRLVTPTPSFSAPSPGGEWQVGTSVTGDEQDIEEMLSTLLNLKVDSAVDAKTKTTPVAPGTGTWLKNH